MVDLIGIIFAIISALSFSAEGFFTRVAFGEGLSVPLIIASRFTMAALLLSLLTAFTHTVRRPRVSRRRQLTLPLVLAMIFTGMVGYGGTTSLITLSFARIPTSLTIIILFAYPTIVAIGEHLLGWQQLTRKTWLAIGMTFAGLLIITQVSWQINDPLGIVFAFAAAAVNASLILATRYFLQWLHSLQLTLLLISSAAAIVLLYAITAGELVPVFTGRLSETAWLALTGLAIFPSLISIVFLNLGIARIGASQTAIISTSEPVFVAILGRFLLGEHWTAAQFIGGMIVFLGVLVISWPERRRPPIL